MPESQRDDFSEVWNRTREDLRASLPASTYEIWLAELRAVGVRGQTLYLAAPDRVRTWVERRYSSWVANALRRQSRLLSEVAFLPPDVDPLDPEPDPHAGPEPRAEHRFERFVIGASNRFAHAAALAAAESPGHAYNPLFLYGDPGLGKTHLLGAIADYLRRCSPHLTVHQTTGEHFTNDFVAAVRRHDTTAFKQRYRAVDVLLIDDVHFLEGKAQTQEEFFHTFNAIHDAGGQIVMTSDRAPAKLPHLTERLRDRFEWGLLVQIDQPDLPTRLAVLRRFAAGLLDPTALEAIALRVTANLRLLEGAVTRVAAFSSLMDRAADEDLVEEVLGRAPASPMNDGPPDVAAIQEATARSFEVDAAELRGASRNPRVVLARQAAMHLSRKLTNASSPSIGRAFERDHTTVLHAHRRITDRARSDEQLARRLTEIHSALTASSSPQR